MTDFNSIKQIRVIKTARDKKSINKAAAMGFRPLLKVLKASPDIHSIFAVFQNTETGEVITAGDIREENRLKQMPEYKKVIDWTSYYPYHFQSPFAAYLIPEDIEIGERVLLEDLIEDYVGTTYDQGAAYRLASCEAIWNGEDFEILYNPSDNRHSIIG